MHFLNKKAIHFISLLLLSTACSQAPQKTGNNMQAAPGAKTKMKAPETLSIMSFNIEDIRSEDLANLQHPRLKKLAILLQDMRPDVVLLKEIAYDQPDAPHVSSDAEPGRNGQLFADNFLAVSQGKGLLPLHYSAFMPPVNTGIASGLDLDRNGEVVSNFPTPKSADPDGKPERQTAEGRAYGGDCWGFGTFPGQYGFALLVREGLEIDRANVRSFRNLPWSAMPGALLPVVPETGQPWYSGEAATAFRLSSKNHVDIPVKIGSRTIHFLASHPTPPAFDGPEERNKKRNHDEIRLWRDYLDGAGYLVDDNGKRGGIAPGEAFVILGDLNADPEKGNSINNPIGNFLLGHPRVQGDFVPRMPATADGKPGSSDTAVWGYRVDYVLPSNELTILSGRIIQYETDKTRLLSDHYPVWLDVQLQQP